MDNALNAVTGQTLFADQANSKYGWVCPVCGNKVYLATGYARRRHFRHWPKEGSEKCERYSGKQGDIPLFGCIPSCRYIPPTWENHLVALTSDWLEEEDHDQADRSSTLFSVDEGAFKVYTCDNSQEIDIFLIAGNHFSRQSNGHENWLSRILKRQGFFLGAFDEFRDAYVLTPRAKPREEILLAGPVDFIERQAAAIRGAFRRVTEAASPSVFYHVGAKTLGPRLSGLPTGWAVLTVHLAEDADITGLDWAEFYPYRVTGGWKWRSGTYLPGGSPIVSRAKSAVGAWEIRRNDEYVETLQRFSDALPLETFSVPGHYVVNLDKAEMSLEFWVEEPLWDARTWVDDEHAAGGWYWDGVWPGLSPVPGAPRVYGARVEGDFADIGSHEHSEAQTREMAWLRRHAKFLAESGRPGRQFFRFGYRCSMI